MAKVREEAPTTFGGFVELIETFNGTISGPCWYRGVGKSTYKLLPSLYRHRVKKTASEIAPLERQLITRFRQRSIPFHARSLEDDWDAFFFMQHYGVPTRLLDWTENPFIALYFAVMSAGFKSTPSGLEFKDDAVVWMLDPIAWNRAALQHQTFDGGILAPGDEELKSYKPSPTFTQMNNHPVALYGAHNSPRIVAQRGTFMLFGQNLDAMEVAFDKAGFPKDSLVKVVLKADRMDKFRSSLLRHGVTESVVFPDLDGLAKEIKREFAFED